MSDVYSFSEGFQLKILALVARDKATFISYRDVIKPKYFKKDIHIDLARIIHNYYDTEMDRAKIKGTEVNPPTLEVLWEEIRKLTNANKNKSKLREQYEDCAIDIMNMDLSDAEYIKDSLIEFGKNAAIEHAILESVDEITRGREKGGVDYNKIEGLISSAIRVGEDIGDLGVDYFETAEERMENYKQGIEGVRKVPTGMSGLDKVLRGGLGDGELGVVIAPPSRGKSFSLINIGAGAILQGYNVVHYTLEMPEAQVAKRYDNRLLQKDIGYLKENSNKALQALVNMQKFVKGQLVIKKYRTNEATVNTIRSHLTRLHMEKGFKPDVIIVDYADLVQPRRTYSDKRFELESVYLDLRDLAGEYNCPVWTASQTNRGGLDKKVITIGDLAEAFNKANIADFMVALCQTTDEKADGVMRFHISKYRDGESSITLDGDIDYKTAMIAIYDLE